MIGPRSLWQVFDPLGSRGGYGERRPENKRIELLSGLLAFKIQDTFNSLMRGHSYMYILGYGLENQHRICHKKPYPQQRKGNNGEQKAAPHKL